MPGIDDQEKILTSPGIDLEDGRDHTHTSTVFQLPNALKVTKCRLTIASGPGQGREYLSDRDRLRIGTHPANDLVLEDRTVSRQHIEIAHTDKGFLLVDLESTNGTWLDGRRVERAYLQPNAEIRIGNTVLSFMPKDEEIPLEPERDASLSGMIGHSVCMRQIFGLIKKIAPMNVPVVIQGETGTGKELAARAIHEYSPRRKGPFLVLDCGAIPPNLIESEFFGHERGSFTGATQSRSGAFERASGGTIFLDELGELRLDLQPKLLRVLENREVRRVGGNDVIEVDVRVIAATNRDLAKEVAQGNFREDLFFRLSVINIQLPPLRERREDIPHLARAMLGDPEVVARHGPLRLGAEAMNVLMSYAWPGNVRELTNVVSHVLTFAEGEEILVEHLPARIRGQEQQAPLQFNEHLSFKEAKEQLLEAFEREYLGTILKRCGGNISQAARESGLHRKSIERLVKKYGLDTKALKGAGS